MSRAAVYTSVFTLTVVGLLGCGPTGSSVATTRSTEPERASPPTEKRRDVQVRTPGADVDVRRDADGRLKVDVRAKDRDTSR